MIAAAVAVAAMAGLVRIWRCQRWLAMLIAMAVVEVCPPQRFTETRS
jgi:hypothetical protein